MEAKTVFYQSFSLGKRINKTEIKLPLLKIDNKNIQKKQLLSDYSRIVFIFERLNFKITYGAIGKLNTVAVSSPSGKISFTILCK